MPTKEQLDGKGWTNVRPMADGRLAGDSEAGTTEHPPAYGIMVDGQGEAVEGVVIIHRPTKEIYAPTHRIPVTTIPTIDEAAGMHEDHLAERMRRGGL